MLLLFQILTELSIDHPGFLQFASRYRIGGFSRRPIKLTRETANVNHKISRINLFYSSETIALIYLTAFFIRTTYFLVFFKVYTFILHFGTAGMNNQTLN